MKSRVKVGGREFWTARGARGDDKRAETGMSVELYLI